MILENHMPLITRNLFLRETKTQKPSVYQYRSYKAHILSGSLEHMLAQLRKEMKLALRG